MKIGIILLGFLLIGAGCGSNNMTYNPAPPTEQPKDDSWKTVTNFTQSIRSAGVLIDQVDKCALVSFSIFNFDKPDKDGAPQRYDYMIQTNWDSSTVSCADGGHPPGFTASIEFKNKTRTFAQVTVTKTDGLMAGEAKILTITLDGINAAFTPSPAAAGGVEKQISEALSKHTFNASLNLLKVVDGSYRDFDVSFNYKRDSGSEFPKDDMSIFWGGIAPEHQIYARHFVIDKPNHGLGLTSAPTVKITYQESNGTFSLVFTNPMGLKDVTLTLPSDLRQAATQFFVAN